MGFERVVEIRGKVKGQSFASREGGFREHLASFPKTSVSKWPLGGAFVVQSEQPFQEFGIRQRWGPAIGGEDGFI